MKKGRILILVVIFMATVAVFGQTGPDYAFKVLANKGANEVKTGSAWSAVKTGASLKKEDEIKVTENSYLGLVHSSGKPMELKQAGTYKVADLAAKMGGGSSVLVKYTDFILSSNSADAKKNRLSATGAVHRGGLASINVFMPDNQYANVYNNIAIINWDITKVKGPYVVIIKNMFDEELLVKDATEGTVQIDLNDPKFASESALLVDVKTKANQKSKTEDPSHLIKRMSPAEQAKIKKALQEITGEVKEETALNKLILAGFYEENKLLIDATTAYEQAIKLAPDVPSYKEAYEEFLLRNKMKEVK